MLIPAAMYKDDIQKLSKQFFYSDKAFYYNGYPMTAPINVADSDEYGELFQYAIIDKDILVGYLSYRIRWYDSCAYAFGLFGFQNKPNPVIGFDLYKELEKIIHQYKIHRIEFRMVKGNTVEKHYQRFVNKYGGRELILKDEVKDRYGNYHDCIIYEIINQEG